MNKSFVLGAFVFAVGVSVGISIANKQRISVDTAKFEENMHGLR